MVINLDVNENGEMYGELLCDICANRPPTHEYRAFSKPNKWNGGRFYYEYLCDECALAKQAEARVKAEADVKRDLGFPE